MRMFLLSVFRRIQLKASRVTKLHNQKTSYQGEEEAQGVGFINSSSKRIVWLLISDSLLIAFQLLGDILLDRSNSAVMTRYASSRDNLRILMNLLRVCFSFSIYLLLISVLIQIPKV